MTRIVIEKNGIRTDVPENEVTHFLRLGYVRVGTLPDALPEDQQVPTPEQAAVNDAAEDLAVAEIALSEAEIARDLAQRSTAPVELVPDVVEEVYHAPLTDEEQRDELASWQVPAYDDPPAPPKKSKGAKDV